MAGDFGPSLAALLRHLRVQAWLTQDDSPMRQASAHERSTDLDRGVKRGALSFLAPRGSGVLTSVVACPAQAWPWTPGGCMADRPAWLVGAVTRRGGRSAVARVRSGDTAAIAATRGRRVRSRWKVVCQPDVPLVTTW